MNFASIGIDLGKTTLHLVALGERSKVLVRKKFSRKRPSGRGAIRNPVGVLSVQRRGRR
jgi:predicted NBD/HSP70 family sugar kinase